MKFFKQLKIWYFAYYKEKVLTTLLIIISLLTGLIPNIYCGYAWTALFGYPYGEIAFVASTLLSSYLIYSCGFKKLL